MSEYVLMTFCEVADTPREFDIKKFKVKDPEQIELYDKAKTPYQRKTLTYEEVTSEPYPNYARFVPDGCCFIDYDDPDEAEQMHKIILHSGLKCLILQTIKGYHFLFRIPDFYQKDMTKATNWFGYKFDTKASIATKKVVQIMRVCGIGREERRSWDLKEVELESLNIDELDVLPYWLFGKKSDKDLYKEGKPGDSEYHLDNTPFTQLMKMSKGGRHNHIVERCSMFALQNGFTIDEFKDLIRVIHDEYLVKLDDPMSNSDLFGDLEKRWSKYEDTMTSSKYDFYEKKREWKKIKNKKEDEIDERRAAEWLYDQYDFYVRNPKANGIYTELLYREKDGDYEYKKDVPEIRGKLKEHSNQNFKSYYFEEVEGQLMQMCAEDKKLIKRSYQYVIAKNKILSCITPNAYDFSWLDLRPPTDVVFRWTWQSEEWVDEHESDLGGFIKNFIKELSRDASGKPQPEVEQWLYIIAGASMIPCNSLEKIVVLAGGGRNGKSLYTSLIRLCLGEDMFNLAKIFDSNPQDSFWGAGLDKGICCIVDDMPPHYDKDAFSYIKGAVTKTDKVEINEKYKPKRTLDVLPQIIACTNFEFELNDKSEGMNRRVLILPTEYEVPIDLRDRDLEHKIVLNTTNLVEIANYRMSEIFENDDRGELCMYMYTREKGVLESLNGGSLAWFANKCRYDYFAWLAGKLVPGESEKMKTLSAQAFKNSYKVRR